MFSLCDILGSILKIKQQNTKACIIVLKAVSLFKVMTSPTIKDVTLNLIFNLSVYHFSDFFKMGMTMATFLFIDLLKALAVM